MSDPIESPHPDTIARILGALTMVLGAIAGWDDAGARMRLPATTGYRQR